MTEHDDEKTLVSILWNSPALWPTFVQSIGSAEQIACMRGMVATAFREPEGQTTSSRPLGEFLGSIRVNPNSERRTHLIRESFAFAASPTKPAPEGTTSINANEEELQEFLRIALHGAEAMAEAKHSRLGKIRRVDVVIGDRGAGKTFFQNYVLSRFSRELDERQTVWVRINLVKDFAVHGPVDIDHWVKTQIAKVLCRYYDPKSKAERTKKAEGLSIEFSKILQDRVKSFGGDTTLTRDIWDMLTNFHLVNPKAERDVNEHSVPRFAADSIFNIAVQRKIRFVVVLDGLDQLGYTDVYREKYTTLLKSLGQYFTTEIETYRYHLLFVRPESEPDVEHHILRPLASGPYLDHANPNRFWLHPVDVRQMFSKRLAALSTLAAKGDYPIDLDELNKFSDFMGESLSDYPGNDGRMLSYLEALAQVNGANVRSSVQLLQVAYRDFAGEHSNTAESGPSARYWLTEQLMRGGDTYPPLSYRYKRQKEPTPELIRTWSPRLFETNFLPSIFRFPADSADAAKEAFGRAPDGGMLLLGLRTLQLIRALQSEESKVTSHLVPSKHVLLEILNTIFDYPACESRLLLQEFVEEELIVPARGSDLWGDSADNGRLVLSPKGLAMINAYCVDVTYLSLAAYNVWLPKSMLRAQSSPFFAAAIPGANLEWIVSKILNSLSLAKLVVGVNSRQQKRLDREQHALDPTTLGFVERAVEQITPLHGGLFSFSTRLEKSVCDVSESILKSIRSVPGLYESVMRTLETYLRQ